MKRITNSDNITKYSIAFILSFSEITTVIIGVKNKKQLIENISYEGFSIKPQIKKNLLIYIIKKLNLTHYHGKKKHLNFKCFSYICIGLSIIPKAAS